MIERILNKYFAKKATDIIMDKLKFYGYDKKVVKTKERYEVYIKNRKEKDEYYKLFYVVYFEEGLEKMIYLNIHEFNYGERICNIMEGKE